MTAPGRFETVYNLRGNFDERHFWGKTHHLDCDHDADHRARESCPFHDLRACGCFQYERWGPGVGGTVHQPDMLCARKSHARKFDCGASTAHTMVGAALRPLPQDTDPGRPSLLPLRQLDSRPWTTTKKDTTVFSAPPYTTVPPVSPPIPPVEPPFHGGVLKHKFSDFPHFAEQSKRVTAERPAFRLKAGKVPFRLDPRLKFEPGSIVEKPKKKKRSVPRQPYFVRQNLEGTFTRHAPYIPAPYDEPKLRTERRPIFTYHAWTKRSMPVEVPWSMSGLSTAEPTKDRALLKTALNNSTVPQVEVSPPRADRTVNLDGGSPLQGATRSKSMLDTLRGSLPHFRPFTVPVGVLGTEGRAASAQ